MHAHSMTAKSKDYQVPSNCQHKTLHRTKNAFHRDGWCHPSLNAVRWDDLAFLNDVGQRELLSDMRYANFVVILVLLKKLHIYINII